MSKNSNARRRNGRQNADAAHASAEQIGGLLSYQALRLMQRHSIRPELASMLAALAFGGGRA